ncbi:MULTISPECIES: hypothetical protein [Haemophilus]|uniref:hypothetical protein n=1 Tax=Haemophilus TaxID=724 RepID=UPI0006ABCCB6|nr:MULTISPECIES: hypothetical protein [Haemophilus]KOQ98264.1 hypothetical protein ABW51_01605 [Haemophilus sp. C1]
MFLFREGFQDSFFANLLAGLMIAFLFFIFKEKVFRIPNIGGIFYLRQRTENTVYNPYKEMELQYMLSLRLEGNKVYGSAEKIYENSSVGKGKEHIIHYEGKNRSICKIEGIIQKRYLSFYDILEFQSFEENEKRKSTTYYYVKLRKKYYFCGNVLFYDGSFSSTIAKQTGIFEISRNEFDKKDAKYSA